MATGTAAELAAGIAVAVADDAGVSLTATATDAAGNTSACSNAISYTEDSTAPGAPTIAGTSPASPANDNDPRVSGGAGGSTVRIYRSADCSAPIAATGTGAEFAAGLTVAVGDDSTTSLTATATDSAGNVSGCSAALRYVEDSTAPQTSISKGPPARVAALRKRGARRPKSVRASFAFGSDDGSAHFLCRIDDAAFSSCASPAVRAKLRPGSHRFSVFAVDPAGNADGTPASRQFRILAPARHRR